MLTFNKKEIQRENIFSSQHLFGPCRSLCNFCFVLNCRDSFGQNLHLTWIQINAELHIGRNLHKHTRRRWILQGMFHLSVIYPSVSWVSLALGRRKESLRDRNKNWNRKKNTNRVRKSQKMCHFKFYTKHFVSLRSLKTWFQISSISLSHETSVTKQAAIKN